MVAAVAAADAVAPARFDLSVLCIAPVACAALRGERKLMWALVVAALASSRIGYALGLHAPLPSRVPLLLTERALSRAVIVGVALTIESVFQPCTGKPTTTTSDIELQAAA
jgi:hypothetical protein